MSYRKFLRDSRGDAIAVEAVFVFPVVIMIFCMFILLSLYLPQRVMLQDTVQFIATAIATELSDTSISYGDDGTFVEQDADDLSNVYVVAISSVFGWDLKDAAEKAEDMAEAVMNNNSVIDISGDISATCTTVNYIIYQELTVTLTKTFQLPVNLSFIGMPSTFVISQQATATVQNGDEFIRNIDVATDMAEWIDKKFGVSDTVDSLFGDVFDTIGNVLDKLGIGA